MTDQALLWCADGHTWIRQDDGTVSPSWGLGGTRMPVADPELCPEPRRNDLGHCWCEDCGEWKHSLSDCIRGLSFTPWVKDTWCRPPKPTCLKPTVGEHRWCDRALPFDDGNWCAWWVRKDGAWKLTFHQGQRSCRWAATYRCIDVRTAEEFDVDRSWEARRAVLAEYPSALRERWWTTPKGALIGSWSTMDEGDSSYVIKGREVFDWIRGAVAAGVATHGQQLTFEVST